MPKENAREKTTSDYSALTCGTAFIKGITIFQTQVLVPPSMFRSDGKLFKREILTHSPLKLLFY